MNNENEQSISPLSLTDIKEAARKLVHAKQDVRAKIHELTMQALTQGELAEQEVRQALRAITEGVSLGAAEHTQEMKAAIGDAINGMDDALSSAAEALHATLHEAGTHTRDFAAQDLKFWLEEMQKLEELFLETLGRASESANELVKQEITAVVETARRTGTITGARVRAVTEELVAQLRTTAHEARAAGKQAAREVGARVATIASNKLADIAAKIQHKADTLKQGK